MRAVAALSPWKISTMLAARDDQSKLNSRLAESATLVKNCSLSGNRCRKILANSVNPKTTPLTSSVTVMNGLDITSSRESEGGGDVMPPGGGGGRRSNNEAAETVALNNENSKGIRLVSVTQTIAAGGCKTRRTFAVPNCCTATFVLTLHRFDRSNEAHSDSAYTLDIWNGCCRDAVNSTAHRSFNVFRQPRMKLTSVS